MRKNETRIVVDFDYSLKSWCLPVAIGVSKYSLVIGVLCFGVEISRIKYKSR